MDNEQSSKIYKYMGMIKKGEKIGHALKRLDQMEMTLELLSATGVGKVINRLRSHEEFGEKALAVVEKWKRIAKTSQLKDIKEEENNHEISHVSNKPTKNKRVVVDVSSDADLDPFAAELAAVDKLNAVKPKKPKLSSQIVSDIERSLALHVGEQSSSSKLYPQHLYGDLATSSQAEFMDSGMFKPRKAMNKVYAGKRKTNTFIGPVPSLFDICMKLCMNNIDAIEETGDIPFDILRPILEKCTYSQLAKIEAKNPYLEEDSDYLWERHCEKVFPNFDICSGGKKESWKQRFMRFNHERDERLKEVSKRIDSNKNAALPERKAQEIAPIAPMHIRRKQIKNGIHCMSSAIPTAAEISKSRRQIFETGSKVDLSTMPKAVRNTTSTLGSTSNSSKKPAKKGALMVKTLKMLKGRKH